MSELEKLEALTKLTEISLVNNAVIRLVYVIFSLLIASYIIVCLVLASYIIVHLLLASYIIVSPLAIIIKLVFFSCFGSVKVYNPTI